MENLKEPSIILMGSRVEQIDAMCIDDGIESRWLMGNAGRAVADAVIAGLLKKPAGEMLAGKDFSALSSSPDTITGAIICGAGNNGGDGFVAAIELSKYGIAIDVFCIASPDKFSEDSRFYFEKLSSDGIARISLLNVDDENQRKYFKEKLENCCFIVDAIFGTGLRGKEVRGQARRIIEMVNLASKTGKENKKEIGIYSVDIPSGIDSDNAAVLGEAVHADITVTFGCKKTGIALYPGRDFAGEVVVADIGIPVKYYQGFEKYYEADLQWVSSKIPERHYWTYKHAVGKLLVIAGSLGYTGAAALTCEAALRTGAGIVTLACPWELNSIMEIKLTEVMTYAVEQTDDITIHMDAFEEIQQLSEKFDALAIGPGLSKNPSTICLVREVLKKIKKPTVLDADGLRALYGPRDIGEEDDLDLSHVVITPHAGELSAILGIDRISQEDRLKENFSVVEKFGLVSVLKGAATIISNPEKSIFINPTGSWALATAGTGDILTGIIGSLLSQGLELTDAAVCGAFIHGLASDIIANNTSRTSQIATDLLEGIKKVFLEIEELKY